MAPASGPAYISVVLSFRNEEAVIPELIHRLRRVFEPLGLEYELLFVNDASTDRSLELLVRERQANPKVKIINMSRRFGVYECLLAGLRHASGDCIVTMDADLQDPPEVIPEMVRRWREGAEIVYTTRSSRKGESAVKMWITGLAYRVLNLVSEIPLPVEAGDFRLLSRRAVNELVRWREKDPYFRGLVHWLGFRQVAVPYVREQRRAGKSRRGFLTGEPLRVFIAGITSFSLHPLWIPFVGAAGFLLGGIGVGLACIGKIAEGRVIPGFLLILFPVLLGFGFVLLSVGVLGLYVGRIHRELRERPDYIIESTVGIGKTDHA